MAQGQIRKAGETAGLCSRSRGGVEQQVHDQQKAQLLFSPSVSLGESVLRLTVWWRWTPVNLCGEAQVSHQISMNLGPCHLPCDYFFNPCWNTLAREHDKSVWKQKMTVKRESHWVKVPQPLDAAWTYLGKGDSTKDTVSLSTHLPAPSSYLSQKSTHAGSSWLEGAHAFMILKFKAWEHHTNDAGIELHQISLDSEDQQSQKATEDRCRWPKLELWAINNVDDGGITWWRSPSFFSRGFRQQEPGETRQDKEDKDIKGAPALSASWVSGETWASSPAE